MPQGEREVFENKMNFVHFVHGGIIRPDIKHLAERWSLKTKKDRQPSRPTVHKTLVQYIFYVTGQSSVFLQSITYESMISSASFVAANRPR